METIAFRMQLDPGKRGEYERRHREIWPQLTSALREAGMNDYRIFLDEATYQLFAVIERRDDHTMTALPELSVMRKWWDYMADLMQTDAHNVPLQQPFVQVFQLP